MDVPDLAEDRPAFTRFYGPNAIYAITPCDERVARAAASQLRADPVTVYVPPGLLLSNGETHCARCNDDTSCVHEGLCDTCRDAMRDEWFEDDDADEWDDEKPPPPPAAVRLEPGSPAHLARARTKASTWAADLLAGEDWVTLDLETTGLNDDAEIVQIGVIASDGDVLFDTLVKPEQAIPAGATRVHGIGDADVAEAPTFSEVHGALHEALRGKTVVAYNADFDRRILRQVCRHHQLVMPCSPQPWQCAMTWYAAFWGEWDEHHESFTYQKLTEACAREGVEIEAAHSALGDCRATLGLIRAMAGGMVSSPADVMPF